MALTAKGTQRIEIIVRKSGGAGQEGAKEKQADEASNQQEGQADTEKDVGTTGKHSKSWWRVQSTHFVGVAVQGARLLTQYYIAGIGYKTGDSSLQAQVERQLEQVTDMTSLITSAGMGLTYGATGGPIGAIAGATMAVAQTGMTIASKYATRQRDYDMKIFKENNAIEYKRARAQINLTTGRLR